MLETRGEGYWSDAGVRSRKTVVVMVSLVVVDVDSEGQGIVGLGLDA